jgi:formate--tetrahydrofolate ligase
VARSIYGARDIVLTAAARANLKRIERLGGGSLPVCFAKTHLSLSDDAHATIGAPRRRRLDDARPAARPGGAPHPPRARRSRRGRGLRSAGRQPIPAWRHRVDARRQTCHRASPADQPSRRK